MRAKHSFTTKWHDYKFNLHPKLLNKKKNYFILINTKFNLLSILSRNKNKRTMRGKKNCSHKVKLSQRYYFTFLYELSKKFWHKNHFKPQAFKSNQPTYLWQIYNLPQISSLENYILLLVLATSVTKCLRFFYDRFWNPQMDAERIQMVWKCILIC